MPVDVSDYRLGTKTLGKGIEPSVLHSPLAYSSHPFMYDARALSLNKPTILTTTSINDWVHFLRLGNFNPENILITLNSFLDNLPDLDSLDSSLLEEA